MPVENFQGVIMLKTASENSNSFISYSDVLAITISFPTRVPAREKLII